MELGVRYTRFWDDGLSGEYRYSDLVRGGGARETAVPDQHELFGKVSVTYK